MSERSIGDVMRKVEDVIFAAKMPAKKKISVLHALMHFRRKLFYKDPIEAWVQLGELLQEHLPDYTKPWAIAIGAIMRNE